MSAPAADGCAADGPVLLAWSSGKDSAWALHALQRDGAAVAGLLCIVDRQRDRVPMHEVRGELLQAQVEATGLPAYEVHLPHPFDEREYGERMRRVLDEAKERGVTGVAFGDLFLQDLRRERERKLASAGLQAHFPLWGRDTRALARAMIAGGLRATLVSVDTSKLPARLAGAPFDEALLAALPADVDPCGENGEFHTFVHGGPMLRRALEVRVTGVSEQHGFAHADVRLAAALLTR